MKQYKALEQTKKQWLKNNPPCTCTIIEKCKNCQNKKKKL
mgnify:CR=1 FL=1